MNNIARRRMRELLETEQCMSCASVFDPLSSRMAESIGFKVGILGGSVTSLMSLGVPDITLLTLNELANQAKRVCTASDLPIIIDGDNGYGNSINVMRAVEELEYAGAAAVTIEDTILPRPFKEPALSLISIEEAKTKLKAAVKARKDSHFSIFARTHALESQSLDELVTRVKAYSAIGIDGICIFELSEKDKLALIAETTDLPIMLISYGDVDLGTREEMAKKNVRIFLNGHHPYEEAVKAAYQSLLQLHSGEMSAEPHQSAKELIRQYSQSSKYSEITSDYIFPA
ncbi:MAG: isocitrate lyase/phosphoenolpyruvate mutase family protein [Amphritea sp.]